ncbi:hypothetical protein S2_154 [Pseudomonas phage vB_PaeM_SCUT-S2]|uniref:hypothetical protein n=1 Tax=Pseudomonas phage C11 TaxID=1735586 RepID=UPI000706DF30|nr:hypothetical protein AU075_gp068 [Pseudomonas phage C11]ALJ97612.1 hypothetical protein C11_152 [Pseudomonas phage C11]AXY86857.1 hypothetical protein PaYy2_63 [Pseudomonas phage PaYy-2]QAU05426.1 hypothetical protein S2_154 [Pseudomonas phage vB_PaeM_SCUT-S2]
MRQLNKSQLKALGPKIDLALELAATGRGDLMNGHGSTCYIANKAGHNILRISYHNSRFVAYGAESVRVTGSVIAAWVEWKGINRAAIDALSEYGYHPNLSIGHNDALKTLRDIERYQ